jgi:hypothetical protein
MKTDTLLITSGCTESPYDRAQANRLILTDVCWAFVKAYLNERQAEKFWGEKVGA